MLACVLLRPRPPLAGAGHAGLVPHRDTWQEPARHAKAGDGGDAQARGRADVGDREVPRGRAANLARGAAAGLLDVLATSWRGASRPIQSFPHMGRLDVRVGRTAALAGGARREARTPSPRAPAHGDLASRRSGRRASSSRAPGCGSCADRGAAAAAAAP